MKASERILKLVDEWMVAEDDTIAMTGKIAKSTKNKTIKIWMDIIKTDSQKHKKVLAFIKDSLTKEAPAVSYDEIGEISGLINDHLALEQKTVDLGHQMVSKLRLPIQKQLFEYLLADEQKHVQMLNALAAFKAFATQNT